MKVVDYLLKADFQLVFLNIGMTASGQLTNLLNKKKGCLATSTYHPVLVASDVRNEVTSAAARLTLAAGARLARLALDMVLNAELEAPGLLEIFAELMGSEEQAKETFSSPRLAVQLKEIAEHEVTTVEKFRVAGGRASSLKQGSAWLEANGYTKQDYTDDDARAAWGHSSGLIGGKATIASHGRQLGNGGRKSSRFFPDDFCPVLSSHPCLPLLRSRNGRNGIWLPGSNVPRVQGIHRGACARRLQERMSDEPNHDEEVNAQANMLPEHGASQASQHGEVALQGQQDQHQQEHIRSQGHLKVTTADANSARACAPHTRSERAVVAS
jgi:hypothetical protein